MKAFLSSTYSDLVAHRAAAKDGLERLGSQVGRMEVFGARPEEPVEACLAEIESCDLFVGIYAHRYGYVPEGSDLSITEQELRHALRLDKPVLCFLVEESHPWPPPLIEGEPGRSRLAALKESLSRAVVRETFTTPDNLAYKLASSVGRWLGAGAAPEASDSQKRERVYATLRSRHGVLYGRTEELEELARLLSPESGFEGVAVQGIGGMGKTALALECCTSKGVLESFDVVLGAQAFKRQMGIDQRSPGSGVVRFEELGTVLRPRELLVAVAGQVGVREPETRTQEDLEREILRSLKGRRALFILDNLETMEDAVDVLALLDRLCSAPTRKALVTTRRFPEDGPAGFAVRPLHAIRDPEACRRLVVDRLVRHLGAGSIPEDAVTAVLEVGQGHPLALELLAGKLATQGKAAILRLREDWRDDASDSLGDRFLTTLCDYVFDRRFHEHVGPAGADLLAVIALEDEGVDEEAARIASGLPDEAFDATLTSLFEAGCIFRELYGDLSVLTLHPITQAYFRAVVA